jgi:hypothetical protein
MKSFILLAICLIGLNAQAESQVLKCTIVSSYLNFTKTITIDLSNDDILLNDNNNGKHEIIWSQTECEDNSTLTFEINDYKDLMSGKVKKAYAQFEHAEPEITLNAEVTCTLK